MKLFDLTDAITLMVALLAAWIVFLAVMAITVLFGVL